VHLSAHCQPAPEKLEADVCTEAEVEVDKVPLPTAVSRAPTAAMIATSGMRVSTAPHGTRLDL
jgi:hypothetical protein